MVVDAKVKMACQIDISSDEAFEILLKTLHMDFVLDEDTKFFVKKDEYEENCVYYTTKDGHDEIYDDRGDLFVALRNVAVNMYPNLFYRSDDYIYHY